MSMAEISKHYDPAEVEARWYDYWMREGLFHGDESGGGDPYCIVIPPPNVTGILHMGHALNTAIQDILVRWRRMKGCNTVWVPGTDHAGIATQNVVERALAQEGLGRDDLGREAFVERVWEWKEQYGRRIAGQLRKIGASCDWERERFTMDEGLSRAVLEVFCRLYDKGLIYQGNYIINWCPRCRTALSDEESEHRELDGKLYSIKYRIRGGKQKDFVVVATTRPETLLGDVAVAVNPRDERYRSLVGKTLLLPILNRELRVIEDDFVDPEFGTGAVKITPAHDPNDFEMGRRHGLEPIDVMNDDGTMNDAAGPYAGQTRERCREQIVDDLGRAGLLAEVTPHRNAVGHCYRCHTMVEPRLSPQWFVKMKPLAKPAIEAVKDGRIRFIPGRWTKVYLEWMENIRDWCISRQIWWGHRIPVYTCDGCGHQWAAVKTPHQCQECGGSAITQDPDVLDTWFSSWLWPFSVFGWPDSTPALARYYPTQTLATASEIIFFWVARMIMAGMEFMDDIPFSEVYIHGTVRDEDGRKMSKSLGNSIDPLRIVDQYSADALRFSLIMLTATGQDVYVSDEKFEVGRNFATKIWNAARFMQLRTEGPIDRAWEHPPRSLSLSPDDQHILAKLNTAIADCEEHLSRFRFNDMAKALYEFIWHQYCDRYVEYSKDILYGDDDARREEVLRVMHYVFSTSLRLLHPVMPFLTEELWHAMGYNGDSESIMRAPWPEAVQTEELEALGISPQEEQYVDAKHDLIRVARTLRADYGITHAQKVSYIFRPAGESHAARLQADRESLTAMLRAERITIDAAFEPPRPMPTGLSQLGPVYMPLEGLVDVAEELTKLNGQLSKVNDDLERVTRKLENINFVNKAPDSVVAIQKDRKRDLLEKRDKVTQLIETLGAQGDGG